MERAAEGWLGSVSEVRAKITSGLDKMDPNGVLGDPRMGKVEAGKVYVQDTIDFLCQWVRDQESS